MASLRAVLDKTFQIENQSVKLKSVQFLFDGTTSKFVTMFIAGISVQETAVQAYFSVRSHDVNQAKFMRGKGGERRNRAAQLLALI